MHEIFSLVRLLMKVFWARQGFGDVFTEVVALRRGLYSCGLAVCTGMLGRRDQRAVSQLV
jgi:hypothetical protein